MEKVYHGKHFTIRITGVTIDQVSPETRARVEAARKELDKMLFAFFDRVAASKNQVEQKCAGSTASAGSTGNFKKG